MLLYGKGKLQYVNLQKKYTVVFFAQLKSVLCLRWRFKSCWLMCCWAGWGQWLGPGKSHQLCEPGGGQVPPGTLHHAHHSQGSLLHCPLLPSQICTITVMIFVMQCLNSWYWQIPWLQSCTENMLGSWQLRYQQSVCRTCWNEVWPTKRRVTACFYAQCHLWKSEEWIIMYCWLRAHAKFDIACFPAFVGATDLISSLKLIC